MINIDWHKYLHNLMGVWTIFGVYSTILVETGSMAANSNIVGYKLCWRWKTWPNEDSTNIFCTFNRNKARRVREGN